MSRLSYDDRTITVFSDLKPADPLPLFRQIVERVRQHVARGALRAGDRLPTIRELAREARVNRNTAARAIQALEAENLVVTRVGRGTFIAPTADERSAELRRIDLQRAVDEVLRVAGEQGVSRKELLRMIDSRSNERHVKVALVRQPEEVS